VIYPDDYVNRVIQGDCLEVMRGMPDGSVDLVVTDPPYKVSQNYGSGVDADNLVNVSKILLLFPEISRVLKPNRFAVIFYDNRILPFLFEASRNTPLIYRKQIFLYRRWGNAHRWVGWMQCTDPVCFFVNGQGAPFTPKIKSRVKHDCYIKSSPESEGTGHPAQKPLEIVEDILSWCSDNNETILDPFLGSGTTAVAAKRLGRRYIGIEIEAEYCEIARKRLAQGELFSTEGA